LTKYASASWRKWIKPGQGNGEGNGDENSEENSEENGNEHGQKNGDGNGNLPDALLMSDQR
jgi:hypothetical protein